MGIMMTYNRVIYYLAFGEGACYWEATDDSNACIGPFFSVKEAKDWVVKHGGTLTRTGD